MNARCFFVWVAMAGIFLQGLLWAAPARSDIYKWLDAKGVVHYSDQAPADKDARLRVETSSSAPPSKWRPPAEAKQTDSTAADTESKESPPKDQPAKPPHVELYVTSWCKYCKMAKAYLRSHNISFTEYDIEKDSRAAERRKELNRQPGVPLAVINGKMILGFSEAAYAQALRVGR
jgi:glutaredoxin-like YruB-family protein